MHCYCLEQFKLNPTGILDITFTDIKPNDNNNYCGEWIINYTSQQALIIATSLIVVVINVVVCFIFEAISRLEKHHTQNDETIGQFQKITIMQFVNIGIIILLVNFNLDILARISKDKMIFGFIPILNGEYNDFSIQWYWNVGATLCVTLTFNIFSPHASKLMLPILSCFLRCWDRGCRCFVKRKLFDKNDDKVHTKKEL